MRRTLGGSGRGCFSLTDRCWRVWARGVSHRQHHPEPLIHWDAALVAEGHRLVRERLAAGVAPGRYQILAAINAVHTSARDIRDTDWSQVVALYDQFVRLDPSPIVALNRAIAVAELDGPEVALAAVDRLEDKLAGYHAYHATRADMLRRLGCSQKSRAAYDKAIELAGNTAETAYLTRRRDQLG
jgi:RNA polymerase sigma-70 factor, ECF subfamily